MKVCSESLQSSLNNQGFRTNMSARSLYLQMKATNQVKGDFAKLLEKHPRLILVLVQTTLLWILFYKNFEKFFKKQLIFRIAQV